MSCIGKGDIFLTIASSGVKGLDVKVMKGSVVSYSRSVSWVYP